MKIKEDVSYDQERFEKLVSNLINSFELIFDIDWDYTKSCLRGDYIDYLVSPNGTFIHPKIEDEGDNWMNRPNLLNAYRQLDAFMRENNIYAKEELSW